MNLAFVTKSSVYGFASVLLFAGCFWGIAIADDALFIDSSGQIGMGTESPARQLHLKGDNTVFRMDRSTDAAAFLLVRTDNSSNPLQAFVVGTRFSSGNGAFFIDDLGASTGGNGARRMTINSSGDTEFTGEVTAVAFNTSSSVSMKDRITPVDASSLLTKLGELPISEWSYKHTVEDRHIGPMAEDFHAMFGLGPDDKHINPTDLAGVSLAAAKALVTRFEAQQLRIDAQQARIDALKTELAQARRERKAMASLSRRIEALEASHGPQVTALQGQ